MSNEENKKGTLEVGKFADLVFLSGDYFNMPVDEIKNLESVLTMVGGNVVYATGAYEALAQAAPPINQDWLPMKDYGRYYKRAGMEAPMPNRSAQAGHQHPLIIGDAGSWRMECPCAF